MYHEDTELLFPPRVITELKGLRQAQWDNLIEHTTSSGETSAETLAFVLMMARLNNCVSCNADSFRALHGCILCSKQTIVRFHAQDKELLALHKNALADVLEFQQQ